MNSYVSGAIGAVIGFGTGVLLARKWFKDYYENEANDKINKIASELQPVKAEEPVLEMPKEEPVVETPVEQVDYSKVAKKKASKKKEEPKQEPDQSFQDGCSDKTN